MKQKLEFVFTHMSWLVCMAWLSLAGGSVQAATMNWTNSAGGDYTNAANWNTSAPGPSDTASFGLNNAYTVNVTAPAYTNSVMQFTAANGGPVLLNLGTNTLTLTGGYPALALAQSLSGLRTNTMIINGGTVVIPNNGAGSGAYLSGGTTGGVSTLILSNVLFNTYDQYIGGEYYGAASGNGSLVVSGGTNTSAFWMRVGFGGVGSVILTNNAAMVNAGGLLVGSGANATGTITIYSGTLSALSGMSLSASTASSVLNLLGGITTISGAAVAPGTSPGSSSIIVSGSNTVLIFTNGGFLNIGGPISNPAQMLISNGTVLSSGSISLPRASNQKGSLTMSGGKLDTGSGYSLNLGNTGGTNTFGDVWLIGTNNPTMIIGASGVANLIGSDLNSLGRVTISNGTCTITGPTWIGHGAGSAGIFNVSGGALVVPVGSYMTLGQVAGGAGQLNVSAGTFRGDAVYVGGNSGGTGTVYVSGGVFEVNTLIVNTTCPSTVTNNGGIFQYTSASPTVTPGTFGTITITNGTVSFRAINNADVMCNQGGGKPLRSDTVMFWTGTSNSFRLNSATNSGTIDQTYTFAPGMATNFARLELVNGSTYRNGKVTIGDNGSLYISGGASTISSVLTAAPSSTIEFDLSNSNAPGCLLSTTNMYLDGCTLQLDLANPPIVNTQFMIISNSLASQLSYSFAGSSTKQTFTLNGTNYLTSISLAGGGTEVLARTTIPVRGTAAFFR